MATIQDQLSSLTKTSQDELKQTSDLKSLENFRIKYLGRKSELTNILKNLKDIKSADEKRIVGQEANQFRQKLESLVTQKEQELKTQEIQNRISNEWRDVTKPVTQYQTQIGALHPITQMMQKTIEIFLRMGFEVEYPNEVDTDFNNFTAVNIPENHPARDMWDTFWTEDGNVAITHTSSMQHRILKNKQIPIRAIIPGRTFRNEATDARHEHTFHQIEGIYVDKGINMSHMLGTIKAFFSEFFEKEMNILFTPDFFPFVEPGGMISIDCSGLGEGFEKVSKGTGWLEVLGCGMIHPDVLARAGVDPNVYSGFAWGVGLERLIMLKYELDDVRLFHSADLRFVRQLRNMK